MCRTGVQPILQCSGPRTASSPDLSPLNNGGWGKIEKDACSVPHRNVEDLKTNISLAWSNMSEDYVVAACKSFRHCVEAVMANSGTNKK